MKPEVAALKKWLDIKGNSAAKLAAKLGYSSSSVINAWVYRNNIPQYQLKRVQKYTQLSQKAD